MFYILMYVHVLNINIPVVLYINIPVCVHKYTGALYFNIPVCFVH